MWITLIKVHPIWLKIAVWFRLMPGMAHTKAQTHQAKYGRARAHSKRGFCPDPNPVENTINQRLTRPALEGPRRDRDPGPV